MKSTKDPHVGVQELCRKLKLQLDELNVETVPDELPAEEKNRRLDLMERLKTQIAELSR